MAGVTWKMAVLMAVLVIFTILEYRLVEAQSSSICSTCAAHARCYSSFTGSYYYCSCRHGYKGDGYLGVGHSGCRKRKLRVWKIIVAIIGAAIGALLLLCLCLLCLKHCLTRRKRRGQPVVVEQGYPQQTPYNQGVPMATYDQKVPQPTGIV